MSPCFLHRFLGTFAFFSPSPKCISHCKIFFQVLAIIYSTFLVMSLQKQMAPVGLKWEEERLINRRREMQMYPGKGRKLLSVSITYLHIEQCTMCDVLCIQHTHICLYMFKQHAPYFPFMGSPHPLELNIGWALDIRLFKLVCGLPVGSLWDQESRRGLRSLQSSDQLESSDLGGLGRREG